MNHTCQQPHASWIDALLASDDAAIPTQEREAIGSCTVCSAELTELRQRRALLGRAGDPQREVLVKAPALGGLGEEQIVHLAYQGMVHHARKPRRVRAWALGAALVAASLLIAFLTTRSSTPADERLPKERMLHPREIEILAPIGRVSDFVSLSWKDAKGPDRKYDVEVWGLPDAGEPVPLLEQSRLGETRLDLDPSQTVAWPDKIEWTVRARGADGRVVAGSEVSAEAQR